MVKKIFGIPGNFGGLDPAKSGESVNCVERLDQNSDSVNGLFRTGFIYFSRFEKITGVKI